MKNCNSIWQSLWGDLNSDFPNQSVVHYPLLSEHLTAALVLRIASLFLHHLMKLLYRVCKPIIAIFSCKEWVEPLKKWGWYWFSLFVSLVMLELSYQFQTWLMIQVGTKCKVFQIWPKSLIKSNLKMINFCYFYILFTWNNFPISMVFWNDDS